MPDKPYDVTKFDAPSGAYYKVRVYPDDETRQTSGCCPRCCDPVEHVECFDPECPTAALTRKESA